MTLEQHVMGLTVMLVVGLVVVAVACTMIVLKFKQHSRTIANVMQYGTRMEKLEKDHEAVEEHLTQRRLPMRSVY